MPSQEWKVGLVLVVFAVGLGFGALSSDGPTRLRLYVVAFAVGATALYELRRVPRDLAMAVRRRQARRQERRREQSELEIGDYGDRDRAYWIVHDAWEALKPEAYEIAQSAGLKLSAGGSDSWQERRDGISWIGTERRLWERVALPFDYDDIKGNTHTTEGIILELYSPANSNPMRVSLTASLAGVPELTSWTRTGDQLTRDATPEGLRDILAELLRSRL